MNGVPSVLRLYSVMLTNLDGKLLHGGVKGGLVAREVACHRIVEKEKLLLHHLQELSYSLSCLYLSLSRV